MPRGTKHELPPPVPGPRRAADPAIEATDIRDALRSIPRATWSGQLAILELAAAGEARIDPATWPARYFALLGGRILRRRAGGQAGPTIDGHAFPFQEAYPWALTAGGPGLSAIVPRAVVHAADGGGAGVVVAQGMVTGDARQFRSWLARFRAGAPGVLGEGTDGIAEFRVRQVRTLFFRGAEQVERAVREGWIRAVRTRPAEQDDAGADADGYALDLDGGLTSAEV